jgi:hypothetical protein
MTSRPADDRTIRNFAWVMLGAAALAGAALLRRGAPWAAPLALLGAGLALVAVSRAAPRSLVGVYRAWMLLGETLGRVTTPLMLGAVFVLVLVPTRLALALLGKDPLTRRFDRGAGSYWSERARTGFAAEDFRRLW